MRWSAKGKVSIHDEKRHAKGHSGDRNEPIIPFFEKIVHLKKSNYLYLCLYKIRIKV